MMEVLRFKRTVLSVHQMRLFTEDTSSGHYTNAQFQLHSGQLALARFDDLRQIGAFADAFSGLRLPSQGRVRFYGRDWREVTPDIANAMRGKIGRVFSFLTPWHH